LSFIYCGDTQVPKPKPPTLVKLNFHKYFLPLSDNARSAIATALGIELNDDLARILEERIAKCRCALVENRATPGRTIEAISALLASGKDFIDKLSNLTAENTGVDGETRENLKPAADQALATAKSLENCANRETQRLKRHPRVTDPRHEVLKMHCGLLGVFFTDFAHPGYRVGPKVKERTRSFVRVVSKAGDIKLPTRTADLDKMIETDIPEHFPPWPRRNRG
jgi:hypothetical protein